MATDDDDDVDDAGDVEGDGDDDYGGNDGPPQALATTLMTAMATTILTPKRAPKLYSWGSGQRIWNSEMHSPTGAKSGLRIFGFGKPRGRQHSGGKIRATDLELGKPLTHGGQNPGGKILATDFGFGKTMEEAKSGRQNPRYGFWFREKPSHPSKMENEKNEK